MDLKEQLKVIFLRTLEADGNKKKLQGKDRQDLEDVTEKLAKTMEALGLTITQTNALEVINK